MTKACRPSSRGGTVPRHNAPKPTPAVCRVASGDLIWYRGCGACSSGRRRRSRPRRLSAASSRFPNRDRVSCASGSAPARPAAPTSTSSRATSRPAGCRSCPVIRSWAPSTRRGGAPRAFRPAIASASPGCAPPAAPAATAWPAARTSASPPPTPAGPTTEATPSTAACPRPSPTPSHPASTTRRPPRSSAPGSSATARSCVARCPGAAGSRSTASAHRRTSRFRWRGTGGVWSTW